MTRSLVTLLAVLALGTALVGCLGPQMDVRVENDSQHTVIVELSAGIEDVRSDVLPDGGIEFKAADQGAWTLSVDGEPVVDSTSLPRSQGPILYVHIDRAGEVRVRRSADG